jgi:hypothetical protein
MASTLAHTASASLIALTFARVTPDETGYVAAALVSASVLDLDHLFYVIRDRELYRRVGFRGRLHQARSPFHELLGLVIVGVLAAGLFWVNATLARLVLVAFTVHLVQDWAMGKASPLAPVDPTITQFFALSFRQKVLADLAILVVFGGLWVLYLSGAV